MPKTYQMDCLPEAEGIKPPLLEKVFHKGRIAGIELSNRIIMPAVLTNLASEQGEATPKLIDFLEARARGGVGLIVVEGSYPHPDGKGYPQQLGIHDDRLIPGLQGLAEAIKRHGAGSAIQLLHMGRYSLKPLSPESLSITQIEELITSFAQAARRAKIAGFDAVEIMAGGGYLIYSFLSPNLNKRNDQYGGDLKGRARFLNEVIAATRAEVGNDFPLICKICRDAKFPIAFEETMGLLSMLEQRIDAVSIIPSWDDKSMEQMLMEGRKWIFSYLSEEIKELCRMPVITGFGVNRIQDAEDILRDETADFVAMARALIAEPELVDKAKKGLWDDIIPCISCNQGCVGGMLSYTPIACSVNATVGREGEVLKPATEPKRVLVIGGGPAGMETARVAALRGNDVTLYEKEDSLGGQVKLAAAPVHKREIANVTQYLSRQLQKLKVKVVLSTEADANLAQELMPDVLIIATGAVPTLPSIPGIERSQVVDFFHILSGKVEAGERVVIMGGGGNGTEVARFLAERRKRPNVTIVERASDIAPRAGEKIRRVVSQRLTELGVGWITSAQVKEIGDGTISIAVGGRQLELPMDTVVIAIGLKAERKLYDELKDKFTTYLIGDCLEPRNMLDAIHEGFKVGCEI